MSEKRQYPTEVYATEDGYAAIAQPDPDEPETDLFIYLTPEQIPQVITQLQELLNDRASWEHSDHPPE